MTVTTGNLNLDQIYLNSAFSSERAKSSDHTDDEDDKSFSSVLKKKTTTEDSSHRFKGKECGYFRMADENGVVSYAGVNFMCDREKNRLTLGDVSKPNNCIYVSLSGGGTLAVNRDNLEDLVRAIPMFSPEDQERIMAVITKEKMAKSNGKQMDDMLFEAADNSVQNEDE